MVLFNEPFLTRYREMSLRARALKERLTPEAYVRHRDVKAFLGVRDAVSEIVPRNPEDPNFLLSGPLAKFRRVKGRGLPKRYRLFFVFSNSAKVIIFLYLNDERTLRKEGSPDDPYVIFTRMVQRGEIGADFDANHDIWKKRVGTATHD